jgi:tetratricopeptide (TPR) repeat protein
MPKQFIKRLLLCITILTTAVVAAPACLWDEDTEKMEQQRPPRVLDLITGRFVRHSVEYYRWRAEDRIFRLRKDPENLKLLDDLAVSYDKMGQHELAIETILKKDAIESGLYETYANLGTFHIHNGNFAEGAKHIRRAIEINANAHFGREIYQLLVVEYVLSKQVDGKTVLPLRGRDTEAQTSGFAEFVHANRKTPNNREARAQETQAALKGVLGMMRFGNFRSPVLLEVVGDLLQLVEDHGYAKWVAARAYLKASYETSGTDASEIFSRMHDSLAASDRSKGFRVILEIELDDAKTWYDKIRDDELKWIASGVNVEAAFAQKYYVNKTLQTESPTLSETESDSNLIPVFDAQPQSSVRQMPSNLDTQRTSRPVPSSPFRRSAEQKMIWLYALIGITAFFLLFIVFIASRRVLRRNSPIAE